MSDANFGQQPLNWFKPVYGLFEQCNMQKTLDFSRPSKSNVPKVKSSTVLKYILWSMERSQKPVPFR